MKARRVIREIISWIRSLIFILVIVYLLNGVIFINAKIPSSSMESTIMVGDRVYGFRMAYGVNLDLFDRDLWTVKMAEPQRFDIIIFRYPDNEKELFIKRIIGLPGETVDIPDGKVYIDGAQEPLDDSFINGPMRGSFGPYKVPAGSYFVLGDNRNNSRDSRYWENTYVTFEQIVGKALVRYWPPFKLLTYQGE